MSRSVGPRPAQNQQQYHGHDVENPNSEREEIDQSGDVVEKDHNQADGTLRADNKLISGLLKTTIQ